MSLEIDDVPNDGRQKQEIVVAPILSFKQFEAECALAFLDDYEAYLKNETDPEEARKTVELARTQIANVQDWEACKPRFERALAVLENIEREARRIAAKEAMALLKPLDVGDDDDPIPPRQWLLGNVFCRQFVSGLIGGGATGKTTIRIAQALALASGRELTGEYIFRRSNVLFICLEDGIDELRRRIRAAMIHHKIDRQEVKGRLLLTTPMGLKLAAYNDKRTVVCGELDAAIRAFVDDKEIDLVVVDPIKKAHGVEENSPSDMDGVVTILAALAIEKNIAVDVLSHERKSSDPVAGDVNRARGAGSMKDGGRLFFTVTVMSDDEAKTLGVPDGDRRSLIRIDSAKVNVAPPSATAQWFKLVGVSIGNGTPDYPAGDVIQTVEPWKPRPLFEGLSTEDINVVLRKLNAGMSDGRRYSTSSAARDRAAWIAVQEKFPDVDEKKCRAIIKTLEKNKLFEIGEYEDATDRKKRTGILSAKLIGQIDPEEAD